MMANVALLTADAEDLILGAFLTPAWGIYLEGVPVIQPASIQGSVFAASIAPIQAIASLLGVPNILPVMASTVDFVFSQDWPISNYPQEQGAFQSYDKVTLPFDVKLKLACGGSISNRQAFLNTCLAIANSFALFDVVTPEITFTSVNCTHIDWPRSARRNNTLIEVDLWFQEISVSASAEFTTTQQPGDAAPQSLGNVQPQTPNQYVANGFAAGNFNVR
jgi:hypothetical protein